MKKNIKYEKPELVDLAKRDVTHGQDVCTNGDGNQNGCDPVGINPGFSCVTLGELFDCPEPSICPTL